MANNDIVLLTEEEIKKIISLERLEQYDNKLKNWVLKRLSGVGGIGNLTEEDLIQLIRTEIDNYTALEII